MSDFHVMLMGSRAAGGFALVFPEQLAITPDGRTGTSCAGIHDDSQIEGLSRVTAIIMDMGAVPAVQLGHTGRKGSELKPWQGKLQLPPDHPDGWQVRGPSAIPHGGRYTYLPGPCAHGRGDARELCPRGAAGHGGRVRVVRDALRAWLPRREARIPVGVSWNLGRPALSNPHWPVWAARELAHNDPFSLMPEDWSWWLRNRPGPERLARLACRRTGAG